MSHEVEYGPWNPGIQSALPAALRHYVTLLRPENIFQPIEEVDEIATFTGLPVEEVVVFRPQRLATHELLIRVCANYSVSDGREYEDLGNNFRAMARKVHTVYLGDLEDQLEQNYDNARELVSNKVDREIDLLFRRETTDAKPSFWQSLFAKNIIQKPTPPLEQLHRETVDQWETQSRDRNLDLHQQMIFRSLYRTVGAILIKHGRLVGDCTLLRSIATNHACNSVCSDTIGELIEPIIFKAAKEQGFKLLPIHQRPVVLNVKGASAAGKSTLRPMQQRLVRSLGLQWDEFALISPDIFRKYLLEYESLGDHFKYAGTCSGQELQIVDQKLDYYVAQKARSSGIPHLLIDRFRFDSFAAKSNQEGSNLLTRFGAKVHMFYMITPPHATVERAWQRGLKVGRFKAVDDLIDHNIEAYNGMPQLFFTWALNADKDVSYEFLDNSVSLGDQPRSVAYGENGNLIIFDLDKLADIDRFQKLNTNAKTASQVYELTLQKQNSSLTFFQSCIERLAQVEICDFDTGTIYARFCRGKAPEFDQVYSEAQVKQLPDVYREMVALIDAKFSDPTLEITGPREVQLNNISLLGRVGFK